MASFYDVLTHKRVDIQEDNLLEQVTDHLKHLLNARQWMLPTEVTYGLPDLESPAIGDYQAILADAIHTCIRNYEKRLMVDQVVVEDPAKVEHGIHARLTGRIDNQVVHYGIQIGQHQLVNVQRL